MKRREAGRIYEVRISLVRALGQIGDDSALDCLRDIATSKSFFFKSDLEKLKKETLAVLDKFLLGDRTSGDGR